MRIGIESNFQEAGKALQSIARDYPRVWGQVLSTLGMRNRKLIRETMQGKGPVKRQTALSPITLSYRQVRGNGKRNIGGKLPGLVKYKKTRNEVYAGIVDAGEKAFTKFQTAEERVLGEDERRARNILGIEDMQYKRPARETIQPIADWPRLGADTLNTVKKRLDSIIKRAAAKAKK